MISKEKLLEFSNLLESASIKDMDKKALKFAIEFLEGKHDARLASKSFLLEGSPGVGKTYLAEKVLQIFDIPIIFIGCTEVNHNHIVKCSTFEEVKEQICRNEKCIVFVDDLSYIFKYSDFEELSAGDRQQFMKIADLIKSSNKRILLFVTANSTYSLDDSIIDRFDVKVKVDIPVDDSKLAFLQSSFSNILDEKQARYLARNSLGYNFRDLPEVIKIAYREGNGRISMPNLKKAIKDYVPTSMQRYEVINNIKMNFSNIIGKDQIKNELRNVILSFKKSRMAKKLGLRRNNLIVFEGPVGTGKTFVVKALAGELDFPIINFKASYFFRYKPENVLDALDIFSKRFENCIIFIDEAEKMIGKHSMDEDSGFDGFLNQIFDGINGAANALVIVAVNNMSKFGAGFSDRFMTIKFELPNLAERKEFCSMMLGKLNSRISVSIDLNEAARMTEGMSFRDLEKICNNVFYRILQGCKSIDNEIIQDFIRNMKTRNEINNIYG